MVCPVIGCQGSLITWIKELCDVGYRGIRHESQDPRTDGIVIGAGEQSLFQICNVSYTTCTILQVTIINFDIYTGLPKRFKMLSNGYLKASNG